MKNLYFLVLLFCFLEGQGQYTQIPDSNFELVLLSLGIDTGAADGQVLTSAVKNVAELRANGAGISDFTGIQDFENLRILLCRTNQLKKIDLSKNILLQQLICDDNKLTILDLSNNKNLQFLNCGGNLLSNIDLSQQLQLTTLYCDTNSLKSLDISKNIELSLLYCISNQLENLDVTKNQKLEFISCSNNPITYLDLSNNKNLQGIITANTLLKNINLKNGNSSKITSFDIRNNPDLDCIEIDNKFFSDTNWSQKKDAKASFSENCSKMSAASGPPVIIATGNQIYCPNTSQKIVETISITNDPIEPSTDAIYIQIAEGYVTDQDLLKLANPAAHPTIITSWDTTAGKLKLFNPMGQKVPYTEFIAAIKDVEYSNSTPSPSGSRSFSITIGLANFLPSTGHYYQYVPNIGISWSNAIVAAEALNYFGIKGYLATIMSEEESKITGEQAAGAGWIGGTDQETEGIWKWVTGPEGLANGGTGIVFWNGLVNGSTPNYANWNINEPNQFMSRQEDYAHITTPGVGITGTWNDLSISGESTGNYQPKGFMVEYGGMPGDPILQISASTKITISKITSTINKTICGSGSVTLEAVATTNSPIYWFDSPTNGQILQTGNSFLTPNLTTNTSYFVDVSKNACVTRPRVEVQVRVNPVPIVNDVVITQCDTDLIPDGKTLFNLTIKNNQISANALTESFAYYISRESAENAIAGDLIGNNIAYENTTPTEMAIYVRVKNNTSDCYSVAKITLKVSSTNIAPTYKIPFSPVCDDFLDSNGNNTSNNDNHDGITSFNFSTANGIIASLLPNSQNYSIQYYKNEADALAALNAITNITNYRNIGHPFSQDIWIRVENKLDNSCYGIGPYLTLKVEALPVVDQAQTLRQCDKDADGIATFDTATLESDLLKGQKNIKLSYFDPTGAPVKDANGALISSPFPASFSTRSQVIKVVLTNETAQSCAVETLLTFTVDEIPFALLVPPSLTTTCDDETNPLDQDGKFAFDTSAFENIILGGQIGKIVEYYDQNNSRLPSPLPNPFLTNSQTITVKVINPLNSICVATTTLNFVVNPLPRLDINLDGSADALICSNLSTFFVTLDAEILDGSLPSNYQYVWTKNGVPVGSNSPTLEVNAEGIYAVEVENVYGCSVIKTINVTASNRATINAVAIVELSSNNSITINVTGPGDYQYSLNEPDGFWQDSNFFANVPAGNHIVYVNDKNGCGLVQKEIVVVGIPKYFTPNGDGYNDVWEIKGMNKYLQAKIQLFDRYGKNLTTLNVTNKSWDGNYNGNPVPSDDYWYILNLGNGQPEIKGHFSLKR